MLNTYSLVFAQGLNTCINTCIQYSVQYRRCYNPSEHQRSPHTSQRNRHEPTYRLPAVWPIWIFLEINRKKDGWPEDFFLEKYPKKIPVERNSRRETSSAKIRFGRYAADTPSSSFCFIGHAVVRPLMRRCQLRLREPCDEESDSSSVPYRSDTLSHSSYSYCVAESSSDPS